MENVGDVMTAGVPSVVSMPDTQVLSSDMDLSVAETGENTSSFEVFESTFANSLDVSPWELQSEDSGVGILESSQDISEGSTDEGSTELDDISEQELQELKDVREEIEEEIESKDDKDLTEEVDIDEQIRLIEETIAMLTAQLESLKKLRGNGLMNFIKQAVAYFVGDIFANEASQMPKDADGFNNEYIDSKISLLEKEILRLKSVRTQFIKSRLMTSVLS